jgi:hypothetical protein
MQFGKVSPNVTQIDRSAPWTKKAMGIAANFTMMSNKVKKGEAQPKDLFDMLAKTSNNFTKVATHSPSLQILDKNQQFGNNYGIVVSYDPSSGNLEFRVKLPLDTKVYQTNISKFEYKGRGKSTNSSGANYTFFYPGQLSELPFRTVEKKKKETPQSDLEKFNYPDPVVPEKPKSPWDILKKKD